MCRVGGELRMTCAAGQTALKEAARVTRQSLSKFCPQPREESSLNPSNGD